MKFSKRKVALLAILPICLCLASSATNAADYLFSQHGFSGGGVISGSFSAVDLNGDGVITFSSEGTHFTLTFSGDTTVREFTHSGSYLFQLIYTVGSPTLGGGSPTQGDGMVGDEGIASNWYPRYDSEDPSSGFEYVSGLGPTGSFGGYVTEIATGAISSTTELIQITAVPEPEAYSMLLAGLGLVGLVAHRRKKLPA